MRKPVSGFGPSPPQTGCAITEDGWRLEISNLRRRGIVLWYHLQTNGLCNHRRWLEAGNFQFKKKRDCTLVPSTNKRAVQSQKMAGGWKFPI